MVVSLPGEGYELAEGCCPPPLLVTPQEACALFLGTQTGEFMGIPATGQRAYNRAMPSLRLAELLASLSLAIDLGIGQPLEWVIRCTLLTTRLAEAMNLSEVERRDVYYLSLLRHVGCTANAHADAERFGDELQAAEGMTLDTDDLAAMLGFVFRAAGKGKPLPDRLRHIARLLSLGPGAAEINYTAHCEVGARLAEMPGFGPDTQQALGHLQQNRRLHSRRRDDVCHAEQYALASHRLPLPLAYYVSIFQS